jgi:hypothetical protein
MCRRTTPRLISAVLSNKVIGSDLPLRYHQDAPSYLPAWPFLAVCKHCDVRAADAELLRKVVVGSAATVDKLSKLHDQLLLGN